MQIDTSSLSRNLVRMVGTRECIPRGGVVISADRMRFCEGEEVKDPEVDLSAFLERQRISEAATLSTAPQEDDDDDIDHDLDHITSGRKAYTRPKKGNVQTVIWDQDLEEMKREKDAAEAARGVFLCSLRVQLQCLISSKTSRRDSEQRQISYERRRRCSNHANKVGQLHLGIPLAGRIVFLLRHICTDDGIVAPPLPGEQVQKVPKEEMQDFLDELLG